MTSEIVSAPRASLAGVSTTGLALILRRPGLLLAWTLLGLPLAAALIAGARWLIVAGFYGLPFLFLGGALAVRLVAVILSCAAYRAILRPEMGGWGLIRLGAAEWRVFFMGFGRNPSGVPMEVFVGLFAGLVVMFGVVAVVTVLIGSAAGGIAFGIGWVAFFVAINVANVRASLAGVAAFVGSPEPQSAGWSRGEGRTLAMVGNAFAITVIGLTLAALVVGLWWQGTAWLAAPSALWAQGLPVDPAGWTRLVVEGGLLALVCSFLLALFTALGSPATAEIWRRVGGPDLVRQRRLLFEEP